MMGNVDLYNVVLIAVIIGRRKPSLRYSSKTLFQGVSAILNQENSTHAPRPFQDGSNPYLQSFKSLFKGLVEQVRIDLGGRNLSMTEGLLDYKEVRSAFKETRSEAMPETVRCDMLFNTGFDDPLVKSTLDLSCCDSSSQLAEEKCLAFNEEFLASFQEAMQYDSNLSVEESMNNLSSLSFDSDPFLEEINVVNIEIYEFRQPDSRVKEEIDHNQITICLPLFLRPDSFQEYAFLIIGQKNRWLTILPFDLNTNGWIVIDLACVRQPLEEAFDRCACAVNGGCLFGFTVRLCGYRIREKEIVEITWTDTLDITVIIQIVSKQSQITLLRSDGVWGPAISKLMIQECFYSLTKFHDSSLGLNSFGLNPFGLNPSGLNPARGCQLHTDWLVMNKRTFWSMNSEIGSVILRSPISWKNSLSAWKLTVASELSYRIDFTSAIRSSYSFSIIQDLLLSLRLIIKVTVQQCTKMSIKATHNYKCDGI